MRVFVILAQSYFCGGTGVSPVHKWPLQIEHGRDARATLNFPTESQKYM